MSDTTASLRRKIDSAGKLQSFAREMKALAAGFECGGHIEKSASKYRWKKVRSTASEGECPRAAMGMPLLQTGSAGSIDVCCVQLANLDGHGTGTGRQSR